MKLKQLSLSILICCLAVATETTVEAASLSVVADNLDNARGVSFGPDGSIYVAEAGSGGNCPPSATSCVGNTGALTKITSDGQQRILSELPSLAVGLINQRFVDGPQELKFDTTGNPYFLYAYGTFPGSRDPQLNALSGNTISPDLVSNTPSLGQLYSVNLKTGNLTSIADLAKYELVNNPDGTDLISNPYALEIDGDTAYVADAGANAVLSVKLDGSDLQAIPLPRQTIENPEFPPSESGQAPPDEFESSSVPTGVTVGADGALYVSEFTGFPSPEGEARIFRIGADGKPEVYADGFTQISDLEFDKDGNLLVLQYADRSFWKGELAGSLLQIAPDGTRTTLVNAGEGLEGATSLAISPDNEIYVTNKGDRIDVGQVVKINRSEPVPEPSSALGILAFGALSFGILLKHKSKKVVLSQ